MKKPAIYEGLIGAVGIELKAGLNPRKYCVGFLCSVAPCTLRVPRLSNFADLAAFAHSKNAQLYFFTEIIGTFLYRQMRLCHVGSDEARPASATPQFVAGFRRYLVKLL